MKANEYLLMSHAIETGVAHGWHVALKHLDMPEEVSEWIYKVEEHVKQEMEQAVLAEVCTWFKFDRDEVA
jgi:hypothetical protein